MFQSKMNSFSWVLNDEWNASHGGFCRRHGVFDEEKFEFDEISFDFSWKMVKWMRNEVLETREKFPLQKFWFEKQTCFKIELDPLLLKKLVCALSPKLLSHSPKENGENEAQGV